MTGVSNGGPLVDTHCHLNHPRLLKRLPAVLERARASGVSRMIAVGYDLPSSRQAVAIAVKTSGVWAAVGVHPHEVGDAREDDLAELRRLATEENVVAIGETGLDFYRDLASRDAQRRSFERHLDLGEELGLPVIVHCRDAQEDVLAAVEARRPSLAIWHCFEGDAGHARKASDLGMMLGFGGLLTRSHGEQLREIVGRLPPDRILLETDAPYLRPEGGSPGDNEPANLPLVAQMVAQARAESMGQIARTTTENALRVFGLRRHA